MARNHRAPYFAVRTSRIHGKGAFALRRIRKGTRIIEYTGERITSKEADTRNGAGNYGDHYHTFLFEIDDNTVIDAGVRGNAARFINHSCDPNCESINDGGRIFIEAIRNIQPGVELSYDYALTGGPAHSASERMQYQCRCGAANCRGTMLLIEPRRKRKTKSRAARNHR